MIVIDAEKMKIVLANKAAAEIGGFDSVEELLETNILDFIAPEERERVARIMAEDMFEKDLRQVNEFRCIRKSGEEIWVSAIGVRTEYQGRLAGLVSFRDITEHKQAEKALRASQRRFRDLANLLPQSVWEIDEKLNFTFVNREGFQSHGYPPEGISEPLNATEVFIPENRDSVKENAQRVLNGEELDGAEYTALRKDGSTFPVIVYAAPIVEEGKTVGLRGVTIDITERKRAEAALAESEERYRGLVESAQDVIFTHLPDGTMTSLNPAFETITGWKCSEWVGKKFSSIIHPDDLAVAMESFRGNQRGEISRTYEARFLTRSGEYVYGEVKATLRLEKERVVGVWGIVRDVTARKRAEEELRESEERYRALVRLGGRVGEAVVMLQDSAQGEAIHTFVSDEWSRITGYSRKKLLGMSFFDLVHPKYREASQKRHRRRMGGESIPGLFELSIIRKDGTEVPIELTSAYTTYKGERASVVYIRDITERKRAEQREKGLQQELNLSSRLAAIGQLAAGVAHEINNPLTGIIGFSELLLRKSTSPETSRDLEKIHSEGLRAAKVIENLRAFARRREPKREYADVNEILARTLELRAYQLRTSNIELAVELAPGILKAMVDFQQIQQVFLNIILNAEQAMTEANRGGKLDIKTEQMKDCVRISFTDDGPGIPAEHLGRLFDPFFTTRGDKSGTGLGLSVCHGIVTEHGGKIYAKSKAGKGATFFVELPLTA